MEYLVIYVFYFMPLKTNKQIKNKKPNNKKNKTKHITLVSKSEVIYRSPRTNVSNHVSKMEVNTL